MSVTIFHNPACSTSRNTLALIRQSGIEPAIVEYLKTPLSAGELRALLAEMGMPVRDLLRQKEALYQELALDDPKWTDDQLLDFIQQHPVLMNRPVVRTPLGTRLCRPAPEAVLELLPPDSLRMLMRYTAWANQRLYTTLSGVDEALLAQPRPGRPAGALGVLGHIYVVGRIWKGHLTGEAHGFTTRSLEPVPPLAELQQLQATLDQWYLTFATGLPVSQRGAPIDFRFVDGGAGRMTAEEMLLHVANHGTYHRGYIADMLYEAGLKPPTMDLPVFVRDAMVR